MPFPFFQRRVPVGPPLLPMTAARVLRTCAAVTPDDGFGVVMRRLQQEGLGALPMLEGGYLVGWITEASVAAAVGAGTPTPELRARHLLAPMPPVVTPDTPLDDLLALMRETGVSVAPLALGNGAYLGVVTLTDVLAESTGHTPAPRMGGMATPLGVYLTTGKVSGGAGTWGLVLTGVIMAALQWASLAVLPLLLAGIAAVWRHPAVVFLYKAFAPVTFEDVVVPTETWLLLEMVRWAIALGLFLLGLRLLPWLVGYHAAEHQTVNALEAGEPLTPEAVARMPRVHPRCGTNLVAIFLMAYFGIYAMLLALVTPGAGMDFAMLAGLGIAAFTAFSWRRIGAWLQQHCTTRRAKPHEIASGIAAAEEVLARHRLAPPGAPTLPQRLVSMGIFPLLAGAITVALVLQQVDRLLAGFWRILVQ